VYEVIPRAALAVRSSDFGKLGRLDLDRLDDLRAPGLSQYPNNGGGSNLDGIINKWYSLE